MKNANRALEVAENELKANSNSIELQEKVIQAKTKVAEVDERITGQRSEMLVNINSLNRENQQLAKTTGGVSTSVKEATKSYEDLNKEIKTALGLDKTVESITKRIKEATELRAEAIKNEMKGKPLTLKQKIHRIIGRSIALPIGHAIQKGWIKKVDISAHK